MKNLRPSQQRGSKPRCHLITDGAPAQVAERLTNIIAPWGEVRPSDTWMPQGFDDLEEAQLGKALRLLESEKCEAITSWWLARRDNANTPNWDIASTCRVGKKKGLLLIEAKAHDMELINEESGKKLTASKTGVSANSRRNHIRIGSCISEANTALADETHLPWALSRDWNYQMSNRFASAWKLTELGVPVILVYLGFLKADEMKDRGKPFATDKDWQRLVKLHSAHLFSESIWNNSWTTHGQTFVPLIRSTTCSLSHLP